MSFKAIFLKSTQSLLTNQPHVKKHVRPMMQHEILPRQEEENLLQ